MVLLGFMIGSSRENIPIFLACLYLIKKLRVWYSSPKGRDFNNKVNKNGTEKLKETEGI